MEPVDTIQRQVLAHGRIKAVRRVSESEYRIEHFDGFAHIVKDPRAAEEGPIRKVDLIDGTEQKIIIDFERLWTCSSFAGPDDERDDSARLPNAPVLEPA